MAASSPTKHPSLELCLRLWVYLTVSVLLIVWALPHTIAARNISLFTGVLASLGWVIVTKPKLSWKVYWPSLCLILVPLWVLVHWYFISSLQVPQWNEINSTWMRTSLAIGLGTAAGLMLAQHPRQLIWLILMIALLPTITFILYMQQAFLQGNWVLPSGPFYGVFKAKFSLVYFVLCQVLVGFGLIYFAIKSAFAGARIWGLVIGVFFVLMGVGDFIATHALNGVIIIALGLLICLMTMVLHGLESSAAPERLSGRRLKVLIASVLAVTVMGGGLYAFWKYDQRYEGKLSHIVGDIAISSHIEKNQSWIRDSNTPDPVDESGRTVNVSTYERISWFIKGMQLIQMHPWGNGISHQAFGYYMREQSPKSAVLMTHSAWIDFTLGLGLPGVLLTWSAIFAVVLRSLRLQKLVRQPVLRDEKTCPKVGSPLPEIAIWLILGMFCFWIIGEVSEREYIEHYFFLIALCASALGALLYPRRQTS